MTDRESELDAFKRLNLSVIASANGYEIEKKKSTKHSVLMSSGSDKIIVSQKGEHYVYCSVHQPGSSGTAIDFTQKVIEPGCDLGRVRQLLRPYLNSGYISDIQQKYQGRYASEIKPSEIDLAGVSARYSRFVPIAQPHKYLCDVRSIPFDLLQSQRLQGRIRHCPRRGSVVFPHWGCPTQSGSDDRSLVGYEIKGQSVNMYSRGGKKGLFISAGMKGDDTLAVTESGLDALSYMAVRGEQGLRVASISGRLNPQQPELIRSAIGRMEEGSTIIAAFDNDRAGDELTEKLADLVAETNRKDLHFKEDRPQARNADWNKVLMQGALRAGRIQAISPSMER